MRRHRFLFLLLAALLWAGVPVDGKPKDADDRLIDRVIAAIHQHRMTSLRDDEMMFACHDSNDGKFREVDVREEHRGHPQADQTTAPRLFTVRAEKRTGALSTDARRIDGKVFPYDGDFRPLPK